MLARLRKVGYDPTTNSEGYMWFIPCPNHPRDRIRISTGREVELVCCAHDRVGWDNVCDRETLVEILLLEDVLTTGSSYKELLAAALVDSEGLDEIPDPEPLIGEDLMFRDTLAWMVGKPGCGKSFLALDMAGCVGTGESWQGYRVHQGQVLYLVAEGVRGTKKRVRAWEKAMGRTMSGVTFLPVAVQARVPAQWDALVELVAELQPVLVVLDTQARIAVGIEENSNTQMGEVVAQAERLREAAGTTVLIVHHIGRTGDTGRGATVLDGAMGTILKVSKAEDQVTVECQKNKDGDEWEDIVLRMVPMGESMVLAVDQEGRRKSRKELLNNRWLGVWWKTFLGEAVSVTTLEKTGVVSSSTFYRAMSELIDNGVVVKEGRGNSTRYRLAFDPSAEVPG